MLRAIISTMDDTSQLLSQLTNSSASSSTSNALQGIQSAIQASFWVGLVLSVILTIVYIVYTVYRMRVQKAILRIDKNLQKLVDFQVPVVQKASITEEPEKLEEPTASDENDSEQK